MYHIKFKSKISYLGEKISILPWQMAEQLAVEVDVKNVTYRVKSAFTKKHFLTTWPLGGSKKIYHMKFKSKISYLGENICILPWKMAEQLAVEVDVKNVTFRVKSAFAKKHFLTTWPLGGSKKIVPH